MLGKSAGARGLQVRMSSVKGAVLRRLMSSFSLVLQRLRLGGGARWIRTIAMPLHSALPKVAVNGRFRLAGRAPANVQLHLRCRLCVISVTNQAQL